MGQQTANIDHGGPQEGQRRRLRGPGRSVSASMCYGGIQSRSNSSSSQVAWQQVPSRPKTLAHKTDGTATGAQYSTRPKGPDDAACVGTGDWRADATEVSTRALRSPFPGSVDSVGANGAGHQEQRSIDSASPHNSNTPGAHAHRRAQLGRGCREGIKPQDGVEECRCGQALCASLDDGNALYM